MQSILSPTSEFNFSEFIDKTFDMSNDILNLVDTQFLSPLAPTHGNFIMNESSMHYYDTASPTESSASSTHSETSLDGNASFSPIEQRHQFQENINESTSGTYLSPLLVTNSSTFLISDQQTSIVTQTTHPYMPSTSDVLTAQLIPEAGPSTAYYRPLPQISFLDEFISSPNSCLYDLLQQNPDDALVFNALMKDCIRSRHKPKRQKAPPKPRKQQQPQHVHYQPQDIQRQLQKHIEQCIAFQQHTSQRANDTRQKRRMKPYQRRDPKSSRPLDPSPLSSCLPPPTR